MPFSAEDLKLQLMREADENDDDEMSEAEEVKNQQLPLQPQNQPPLLTQNIPVPQYPLYMAQPSSAFQAPSMGHFDIDDLTKKLVSKAE